MTHREKLFNQLLVHEGLKLHAYRDTEGYLTIGCGFNISHRGVAELEALLQRPYVPDEGITRPEALTVLDLDVSARIVACTEAFDWFNELDPVRQRVIVDMTFNMGVGGVKKFKKMIAAIIAKDWMAAAHEIRNSKFAKQTKGRAVRLAQMMQTGEEPLDLS